MAEVISDMEISGGDFFRTINPVHPAVRGETRSAPAPARQSKNRKTGTPIVPGVTQRWEDGYCPFRTRRKTAVPTTEEEAPTAGTVEAPAVHHENAATTVPPNRAARRHPDQEPPGWLLDYAGAAKFLHTSERHVRCLWETRRLAGRRVGKFVRFAPEDLIEYADRNRREAIR
jgi:hypothetical protein